LHIRARHPPPAGIAWLIIGYRRPLLAGMLANERGQDFHHRWVVSGRVAGYSLQRVDAADTHVEFVGAELLDRLGVTVSHLPLLREFNSAARQFNTAARQHKVPSRVHQRQSGEQACAECDPLRPHSLPGSLQLHRALRRCDQADVMRGEQIGDWPEERTGEDCGADRAHDQDRCPMGLPQRG
jgi:hypothetical protein